jgi:hypothetical protein
VLSEPVDVLSGESRNTGADGGVLGEDIQPADASMDVSAPYLRGAGWGRYTIYYFFSANEKSTTAGGKKSPYGLINIMPKDVYTGYLGK